MKNLNSRTLILLTLGLVLLCAPVGAAAQVKTHFETFSEAREGNRPNLSDSRIAFSRVTWYFRGPVTSCSFKIEQAEIGGAWTDLVPIRDCSSEGKLAFITRPLHIIMRFVVTEFTGTGEVAFYWEGFTGEKCGLEYPGIFSTETIPNPATGEELSTVIPLTEKWRIHSAAFELQASGAFGDREVFLTVSTDGNVYFRVLADGVVEPSQRGRFTTSNLGFVSAGLGPASVNQPAEERTIMVPIYSGAFIPGGDVLSTETINIDPDDSYGSVVIKPERCPS